MLNMIVQNVTTKFNWGNRHFKFLIITPYLNSLNFNIEEIFLSILSTDILAEHEGVHSALTFTFLHFLAAIDLDFFLSDSRGTVYVEV